MAELETKKLSPSKTRALREVGPGFGQDDWDQCLNIEECARESRKHDNSDIPQIIAMAAKCVLEPESTQFNPVKYESEDDENSALMPPKKKVKRERDVDSSREPMPLLPSEDYRSWMSSLQEVGLALQDPSVTPNSGLSSMFDSFLELSETATWLTNGDKESHQFEIHEETEEEQQNAEQTAAELYDPAFNDNNKENEPALGEAVALRMESLQEFDFERTVFGELLDYNQHHLESPSLEPSEIDEEDFRGIVQGTALLDDPFTSNNETTMSDIDPSNEFSPGDSVIDVCGANTDAQEVNVNGNEPSES